MPPLGKAPKICLICLKRFKTIEQDTGESGTRAKPRPDSDLYKRFLHFIGNYLKLKTFSKSLLEDLKECKNGGRGDFEPFCGGCRALVCYVCDLYAELQVVKLRLVWKLSQLGGSLKESRKGVSYKLGRELLKGVAKQLKFKAVRRLELLRKALEVKCVSNGKEEFSLKPVIHQGLCPERWQFAFSPTKVMLTRLIVVFLLGSTCIYMRRPSLPAVPVQVQKITHNKKRLRSDERTVGRRSRDPAFPDSNDSEAGSSSSEDTEVLNVPWTLQPKGGMKAKRIKLKLKWSEENANSTKDKFSDLGSQPELNSTTVTQKTMKLRGDGRGVEISYAENDNCFSDDDDYINTNADSDPEWNCSQGAASPTGLDYDPEIGFEDSNEVLVSPSRALRSKRKMTATRIKLEPGNDREDSDNGANDNWEPERLTDEKEENHTITKKSKHEKVVAVATIKKSGKHRIRIEDNRPRNFPCTKCSRKFLDARGLATHLNIKHRAVNYFCNYCSMKFTRTLDLINHRRKVHINYLIRQPCGKLSKPRRGKTTTCPICNEEFPSCVAMIAHRRKVHLNVIRPRVRWLQTRFECPICYYQEFNEDQFRMHLLSHENLNFTNTSTISQAFYCEVCGEGYDEENVLQQHMEEIHQGTFLCHYCDAKHTSGSLLVEHLETHETNQKSLQCRFCPRQFSSQQYYNIHRKLGHKNRPGICCDDLECSETFGTVQELNEHLKWHMKKASVQTDWNGLETSSTDTKLKMSTKGTVIFTCSVCTRGVLSKQDLVLHELTHTPQTESDIGIGYNCPKCRHRAQFLETLIIHYCTSHEEIPEGESPNKCPTCDKIFPSTICYKAHLQAHQDELKTSEEMFSCDICRLECTDRVCLRLHRQTHAQPVDREPRNHRQNGSEAQAIESKLWTQEDRIQSESLKRPYVQRGPYKGTGRRGPYAPREPREKRQRFINTNLVNKCVVCDKDFESISYLKDHLESIHETEEKQFHCWFCPLNFTLKQTAEVHRFNVHAKLMFPCEDIHCGQKFPTAEELEGHLREHLTNGSPKEIGSTKEETGNQNVSTSREGTVKQSDQKENPIPKSNQPPNNVNDRTRKSTVHCQKCNWAFMNPDLLELHEFVHAGLQESFKCPKCFKIFETLLYLRHHFDKNHTKFIHGYECSECNVKVVSRESLKKHMKRHELTREIGQHANLACKECDYSTKNPELLKIHVQRHRAELLSCPYEGCSEKFNKKRNLRRHIKRVHDLSAKRYPCPICGVTYLEQGDVRTHMNVVHADRNFCCDLCGKSFKRGSSLNIHKKKVHFTDTKDHICSECGVAFKSLLGLQFHVGSVHTPESERRFGCPHCPKRYHRQMLLRMHVKTCMKMHGIVATDSAVGQISSTSIAAVPKEKILIAANSSHSGDGGAFQSSLDCVQSTNKDMMRHQNTFDSGNGNTSMQQQRRIGTTASPSTSAGEGSHSSPMSFKNQPRAYLTSSNIDPFLQNLLDPQKSSSNHVYNSPSSDQSNN